ncbi:thioredoxin domain-containing protein [Amnibacterium flavum]|uniref:Thioredoxin domain-containing protein n=1 Tax=Amnibacterium flavum TaxID=2173173 RepID=A0A2V1HLW3_9MICO|nr:DUF255 domain-containing protein [Amnibacterium flavum]PVZ93445.1 thioredoxin domain-containing protein [Amnibacterium flavum]
MNRLADAVSPYLRSHADNPVDWWPWGAEAFEEAERRDLPVMISIGYATCHWCHVMARESFSDPAIAAYLADRVVAIKVDREEHPDVDAAYLAAAGAFTQNLGWPLTVFATPKGRTFFAGTYAPPVPAPGQPSFRQVVDAVWEAWTQRRGEVEDIAGRLADALAQPVVSPDAGIARRLIDFGSVVGELASYEDSSYGGFGGAPKFPVAPVVLMLQQLGLSGLVDPATREAASGLARRTLSKIAASDLRDPVEGGFFRYGTKRDWSEPHYERMLYDNALLLRAAAVDGDEQTAAGVANFLASVLRRDSGGFGSAQDSESTVDGVRVEGGYYLLDADSRSAQSPPAVDGKVLTGWNGLAIGALAAAGSRFDRPEWIDLARAAADHLLAFHVGPGSLLRASLDGRPSAAAATLEDYGMLSRGLLDLSLATGESGYAAAARDLVDRVRADDGGIRVPGGGDPTLAAHGSALPVDPSEGAYPSGLSELAMAALTLYDLTGEGGYRALAERAVEPLAELASARPISMGGTLAALARLRSPSRELVVVTDADGGGEISGLARRDPSLTSAVVTEAQAAEWTAAGFGLFDGRVTRNGRSTAYLCVDLVCRLPVTEPDELQALLVG